MEGMPMIRLEEMPMTRHFTMRRLRHLLYVAVAGLAFGAWDFSALAQEAPTERVAASLTCGSHSANPTKLKAFQFDLQFEVFGSLWVANRTTSPQPGTEKFRGILSPSGTMLIAGQGKTDDGATWTYEFSGRKKPDGITILRGSLRSEKPKGTRTCSLTIR
jgi:hypothetical protein